MAFVLGLFGALLGWAAGSLLPSLKEICPAFALFGGLLAAILGAILGGVFDISQAIRNQGSSGRG
jgi:apolipoprotein N-acyltransferase